MDNKFKVAIMACCIGSASLSACSRGSLPSQELRLSEESIKTAIDSGAEDLAKEELASAQSKLTAAKTLIKKKKYKDARPLLSQSTMEAKLAAKTAQASTAKDRALKLAAESSELQRQLSLQEQNLAAKQEELDAFKELQAQQTDRGMVLTLGDVLFTTNESTLNESAIVKMDRLAAFMQRYPNKIITIEGHTDNTGDDDYNLELSESRATSVMQALQSRNIGTERITIRGMGERLPVAGNDSAAGRQQNRRVEILFKDREVLTSDIDY